MNLSESGTKMESLWTNVDAARHQGILAERVYSSRLLGANPALVLHGGGNTSVKGVWKNIFGEDKATLFVKGSGSDLATIELKDFVPVRLDAMLKLSRLEKLSDIEMARELKLATLYPNAVFDTGIWTEEVLSQRATHYGMTVDEYKRNNVLHEEVSSKDVAELAAEMCSVLFSKITGAQIPIDGGNDRVI
jgi:hypothetical protein